MLSSKDVFTKLKKMKKLPSPSGATLRVLGLCYDETASIKEIADTIELDSALSAEILKYANACYISSGVQVTSIQRAVVKLGIQTVISLALGFSLISGNKTGECKTFDYERFWSISLLQAIAAKNLAEACSNFNQEEIFIVALLSHMGQLGFASSFPDEYGDLLTEFEFEECGEWGIVIANDITIDKPTNRLRKVLEQEHFQIDSSELTVELFLDWGIPAHYALAAGYHNDLRSCELGTGETQRIVGLLNLSRNLAELCFHFLVTSEQLEAIENKAANFDIAKEDFADICDETVSKWQELGRIIDIHTHEIHSYADLQQKEPCLL